MAEYSELSVLIVDPNPGMRGSLHNMLNQSGITKIDYAVSSGTAIRQLAKKPFDIVLCEYDLGNGSGENNGQDGQQLLEDLRHHKLIAPSTIFIMLTSEGVYSKVIGAAELTPTDYVLKPFTVDALLQRLRKAVERRDVFLPIHQLVELGSIRKAIGECGIAEEKNPRYAIDFARLRAELLVSLDELADAEVVYQVILMNRPIAWAHLGMARCQFGQQKYIEAQETLQELLVHNPKFMAAYDLLARTHEALGQQEAAKKILEDAVAISPNMVHRLRHLGEVAFETGDVGVAEKAFKQVVAKAKYSEFRDPEDHVKLVKTLVKKGDAHQASGVIRDMERSLRGSANVEACRAIAAGLLQEMTGNISGAAAELANAVSAVGASRGLSTGLKIGLVHSCLNVKLDQQASDLMLNLMNDTESGVSMDDAVQVFEKAGRHDLAAGMGEQIKLQVDELIAHASEQRGQGDLRAAVDTLNAALRKAPANMSLLPAATSAILKQLDDLGWEVPLAEQCAYLLERMRKIDPSHPSLEALQLQYSHTQRKYGIATTA
ncbi:response regulator [Duganella sp. BJB488]|uniref:tetratricopeptide repeat-containing response regulator n=1 Tax=unclassified Duganella TaxID=2636909 RepID=UPI000E349159|nr:MULTISPECIES: tetratricopeptide repeat-containing response regulator [unclassified Duganella]NVD72482.1 response regulator [Duganella sp. BJB1802]RFP11100.1 response regulator [Duganella sp. BJB489]RFP14351.1 response regulator [Duganella sp. BJB488]RFP30445.1 response regulator [Duganella sp. BJB480]